MSVKIRLNRLKLKAIKHAPQIATIGGVAGLIGAGIWACKRTMKMPELVEKHKMVMDSIEDAKENDEDYTEKDAQHDTIVEYKTMTVNVVKLYGIPVAIAVGSTACIIGSHVVMNRRNVALASSLSIVTQQFRNYRNNVIKELGEEVDREFRFNLKESENEDEKNPGGENSEKQNKNPADEYGPFTKIFDESNPYHTKDPEQNRYFLSSQQNFANEKLREKGFLFLNDILEMLGFPKTRLGQIWGWTYDETCPISDNYIDFGLFNFDREKIRDFHNGYEYSIILDFNCVPILDYI